MSHSLVSMSNAYPTLEKAGSQVSKSHTNRLWLQSLPGSQRHRNYCFWPGSQLNRRLTSWSRVDKYTAQYSSQHSPHIPEAKNVIPHIGIRVRTPQILYQKPKSERQTPDSIYWFQCRYQNHDVKYQILDNIYWYSVQIIRTSNTK